MIATVEVHQLHHICFHNRFSDYYFNLVGQVVASGLQRDSMVLPSDNTPFASRDRGIPTEHPQPQIFRLANDGEE